MQKTILRILLFSGIVLSAQSIDDLSFGTDSTFEALTWNIEWFPKNGQTTVNYVSQIIEALDVDLLALQEISDTTVFKQMVNNLDGYDYYFKSGWYAGLAYVYKPDVIQIDQIYEIYTTQPYWSPFPRSPMVMEFTFLNESYVIINNHYKCCGDGILDLNDPGDEETRRYIAQNLLTDYINNYFADDNVFLVGDLNDNLTDIPQNNVFQLTLNDTDNYLFADYGIAAGSSSDWSYPTWPSHLDHILITYELFDEYNNSNTVVQTIKIDQFLPGGWNEYDVNISDHRPVAIKFTPQHGLQVSGVCSPELACINYPNPFNPITTIQYELPQRSAVQIAIYDLLGREVITLVSEIQDAGYQSVQWNASNVPSGMYFYQIRVGDQVQTKKLLLLK